MAPTLTRKVGWSVGDRCFALAITEDVITLDAAGHDLVSLKVEEWEGVRAGLDALVRFQTRAVIKPRLDRSTPEAPSNGQPWTPELDRDLCRGWYAGDGLAVLARRFGRTEGSIASRLVKLDCVADSDEARARP